MARPVSSRIAEIRVTLERRLREGMHRQGDRFLSNRAVATQYGISYQTAQRLLSALVSDGLLVRRAGSGTYLPGGEGKLCGVDLLFNTRAKRRGSFGAKLLSLMRGKLQRLGVETSVRLIDPTAAPLLERPLGRLPVIWDLPAVVQQAAEAARQAIVLNDRPAIGFAATHIDSISVDNFTGGACAAQMLASCRRVVIFAGPSDDRRSQERVGGFLTLRQARVIYTGGWLVEDGLARAAEVLARRPDGVFCCNDRLAESLVQSRAMEDGGVRSIVGFDDAPVATTLQLDTIAIPWAELVGAAVRMIKSRLAGDRSAAIHQVIAPRPIRRR